MHREVAYKLVQDISIAIRSYNKKPPHYRLLTAVKPKSRLCVNTLLTAASKSLTITGASQLLFSADRLPQQPHLHITGYRITQNITGYRITQQTADYRRGLLALFFCVFTRHIADNHSPSRCLCAFTARPLLTDLNLTTPTSTAQNFTNMVLRHFHD